MGKRQYPVCAVCGSADIVGDTNVGWDMEQQDWVAQDVFDDYWCGHCESECDIAWMDEGDDPQKTLAIRRGEAIRAVFDAAGPHEGEVFHNLPEAVQAAILLAWQRLMRVAVREYRPLVYGGSGGLVSLAAFCTPDEQRRHECRVQDRQAIAS